MAQRTGAGRGGKARAKAGGRAAANPPPRVAPPAPKRARGRKRPQAGSTAEPGARAAAGAGRSDGASARDGARGSAGGRAAAPDWSKLADRAARKLAELVDKARPAAEKATEAGRRMAVDLEGGIDEAFGKVRERARDLLSKGQHTRVNIRFRGRTLAELPIAVVAAAEVASLWWFGPLRLVLGHFVGKSVLDVEFVSNADEHATAGRALLADGDVDEALAEFDRALSMDRRCAGAHLGRGIALKLRGDKPSARAAFERAEELDRHGEVGREARRHLDNLGA